MIKQLFYAGKNYFQTIWIHFTYLPLIECDVFYSKSVASWQLSLAKCNTFKIFRDFYILANKTSEEKAVHTFVFLLVVVITRSLLIPHRPEEIWTTEHQTCRLSFLQNIHFVTPLEILRRWLKVAR